MTQEFKGTLNWRVRKVYDDFFFIEADLPNAKQNGHYPRLDVMQEDFGDHNGYTYELRMADAQLIAHAPEMLDMLKYLHDKLGTAFESEKAEIKELITKATTV